MIENLKIKGNLSREKVLEYLVKNRYDLKYFKVQRWNRIDRQKE